MKVLLVAGGTGGHIMPAVAFGEYIRSKKNVSVRYVCGTRPLEIDIYRNHGIKPAVLPMEGSPAGVKQWKRRVGRLINMIKSFFVFNFYVKSFSPDMCILFGGYISFPALMICRLRGIKTILHEQNCVAGKVTRLASRMKIPIVSGWNKCEGVSASVPVGIPVRQFSLVSPEKAAENMKISVLPGQRNRYILVTGGSLGSFSLNQSVIAAASMIKFTGLEFLIVGKSEGLDFSENIHFIEPQWDISNFISIADIIICRGGGSSLAEMMAYGIPTIVCPWAKAADDHQNANARFFVEETSHNSDIWIEDQGANVLADKLLKLLKKSPRETKSVYTAIEKSVYALWRVILSHN